MFIFHFYPKRGRNSVPTDTKEMVELTVKYWTRRYTR